MADNDIVLTSRGPQRQQRGGLMTKKRELAFLSYLAETANITEACRQAGIAKSTVYHRRRTRPEFAAAWEQAIVSAYSVLESAMLARALIPPRKADSAEGAEDDTPPMSDATRMTLLARHYKMVGLNRVGRGSVAAQDAVMLRRDIMKRFEAIARQMGMEVPEG